MQSHARFAVSFLSGVFVAATAVGVRADVIEVPGDVVTIQGAIELAQPGDVVLVAPGTYYEAIDFLGKAITVRSSAGPALTTLDGSAANTSVVRFMSEEGPDSVLDGFTLTGGDAVVGGGIRMNCSHPTVLNCNVVGNEAIRGGGAFMYFSDPVITNCTFDRNEASENGGGVYNIFCVPLFTGCTFRGNTTPGDGGGLVNKHGQGSIIGCTFVMNEAGIDGGGMVNLNSTIEIRDTFFSGNVPDQIEGVFLDLGGNRMDIDAPATGACCLGDACVVATAADCTAAGGIYEGDDASCAQAPCSACPGDLDGDGTLGFGDLLLLLSDWGPCP